MTKRFSLLVPQNGNRAASGNGNSKITVNVDGCSPNYDREKAGESIPAKAEVGWVEEACPHGFLKVELTFPQSGLEKTGSGTYALTDASKDIIGMVTAKLKQAGFKPLTPRLMKDIHSPDRIESVKGIPDAKFERDAYRSRLYVELPEKLDHEAAKIQIGEILGHLKDAPIVKKTGAAKG